MGRRPTARSRWASQGGEGRTVSPVMRRAQKRGQRSGASISTDVSAAASSSPSFTATCGKRKGALLRAADSQFSNRWGNILDFHGFDLITPNEREARFALGDQDSGVRPLAQTLFQRAGCRYLILKLGERGILTYRSPG